MGAPERALQWDTADRLARPASGSFDIALNRRQLLAMAGLAAASLSVAGPFAPLSSGGGSASSATAAANATVALGTLSAAQFFALLGESFKVEALDGLNAGNKGRLTLSSVSVPDPASAGARPDNLRAQPFSLLFTLEEGALGTSGVARLEQETVGRLDLFIHRVLPGDPTLYEAVFN
jgi:hypothetical protein